MVTLVRGVSSPTCCEGVWLSVQRKGGREVFQGVLTEREWVKLLLLGLLSGAVLWEFLVILVSFVLQPGQAQPPLSGVVLSAYSLIWVVSLGWLEWHLDALKTKLISTYLRLGKRPGSCQGKGYALYVASDEVSRNVNGIVRASKGFVVVSLLGCGVWFVVLGWLEHAGVLTSMAGVWGTWLLVQFALSAGVFTWGAYSLSRVWLRVCCPLSSLFSYSRPCGVEVDAELIIHRGKDAEEVRLPLSWVRGEGWRYPGRFRLGKGYTE